MIICPHCGANTDIPDYAFINVTSYQKQRSVKSDCCGKALRLIPRRSVDVIKQITSAGDVDDWGDEYTT